MKKTITLFLIAFILLAIAANAQIQRGNFLVGGDIANLNLGLNKGSAFTVNLDPKLAFFVKDNAALGGYLNLDIVNLSGHTSVGYGVGLLGRKYFEDKKEMNPLKHSRFFLEANVGISGRNEPLNGGSTNGLGVGFGPGLAYFISSNIGLETLLKYNTLVGFGDKATQSNLELNFGFQIYLPTRGIREKISSDVR